MAYEFRLPDLGEGVTEAEVTAWLVREGQRVSEDDAMVELASDKATVEIAAPVDGVVQHLHVHAGATVQVGDVLITIDTGDGAAAPAPAAEPTSAAPVAPDHAAPTGARSARAAPAVRKLARDLGVDIESVGGSGPDGAVTERDVRAAAEPASAVAADTQERREPIRGVRRRIAERLVQSHREVPKVTVVEECDFTELAAARGDTSLSPYIVQAVVSGLRAHPELNASLDGDELVYHSRYDIGVATQGGHGLVVPVLRGADRLSIAELDAEIRRLAEAVRSDSIGADDLRGSTFTVTLAGKLGGYFATPLVNLGEAAILGVHRIAQRPVVRDGEIVIRDIGLVSCSFDHRITDGTRASMFLLHVIERLQQPGAAG